MSSRLESHGIIYIIITTLGGGGRCGDHTQHLHGVWLFCLAGAKACCSRMGACNFTALLSVQLTIMPSIMFYLDRIHSLLGMAQYFVQLLKEVWEEFVKEMGTLVGSETAQAKITHRNHQTPHHHRTRNNQASAHLLMQS